MVAQEGLRVMVVGDDVLARNGLIGLLGGLDAQVVAQSDTGPAMVAAAREGRPEVVLWDLGLSMDEGLSRLRAVESAGLSILALLHQPEWGSRVLASGARGALRRDAQPERLYAGLHAVAQGLVVAEPGGLNTTPLPAPTTELTSREQEVLQLLAEGLPNKLIADRLGISDHTAKFHVNAILAKLGVQGRTEAVVRAARMGLILI